MLRGAYGTPPLDTIRSLRSFGGLPTVAIEDADAVAVALDLASGGMDFADAPHPSRSGHCEALATFDRQFVRTARDAGHANVRKA